ncbi:hypothetical protein LTS10_011723 [Elasticomyces elasticus]|nr:hypothetical protein LTS10_011723 [Elasticomyces elasticus]
MVRDFVAKEQYWIAEKALEICFWPIGVLLSFCEGALRRDDTQSDCWILASSYLAKASSHMASLYPGAKGDWNRSRAVMRLKLLELARSLVEKVLVIPTVQHITTLLALDVQAEQGVDIQMLRGIEDRVWALGLFLFNVVQAHSPELFPSCIYKRHWELSRGRAQPQAQQGAVPVRSGRNLDQPRNDAAPPTLEAIRARIKKQENALNSRTDQENYEANRKQIDKGSGYGRQLQQSLYTPATYDQFEFVCSLGHGSHTRVTEVRQLSNNKSYAMKFVLRAELNAGHQSSIMRRKFFRLAIEETFETMRMLSHEHIAEMLFCVHIYKPELVGCKLFMLPVADANLQHFLERSNFDKNELPTLDQWFGCLASALSYAHGQNVKHGSIKPANILIKDNRVYLADFGSALATYDPQSIKSPAQSRAGSAIYWAPERGPETGRGIQADIFALGCVFSEMLTFRERRTLEEYREARKKGTGEEVHAFRANLPEVWSWLMGLPDYRFTASRESPQSIVFTAVQNMLAGADHQWEAGAVHDYLCNDENHLFCGDCRKSAVR